MKFLKHIEINYVNSEAALKKEKKLRMGKYKTKVLEHLGAQ